MNTDPKYIIKNNPNIINAKYVNPFNGKAREAILRTGGLVGIHSYDEQMKYLNNVNPNLSTPDVVHMASLLQPLGEQIGRGAANFGKEFAAGFIEALGSTVDIRAGLNSIGLIDGEINNVFFRTANNIRKSEKPIYEKKPGSVNFADPAWWFNQIKTAGQVTGLALEAMLETALITAATGGIGDVAEIPKALSATEKMTDIFKIASKSKKIKNFATTMAVFSRYKESVLEAEQTQNQLEQEYLQKGFDKDSAIALSSRAASETFWKNMPLAILDVVGIRTMFVNPVSGASEELMEKLISKIPTAVGRGIAKAGAISLSEGSEEFIQNIIQDESAYHSKLASGLIDKPILASKRFNKYMKDADNWNAFFGGAIGGIIMDFGSPVVRKIMNNRTEKYFDDQYNIYNSTLVGRKIELIKEIKKAEQKGNFEEAMANRRSLNAVMGIHALHLDHVSNREGKALKSYKEYLSALKEGLSSNDEQLLKELNLKNPKTKDLLLKEIDTYTNDINNFQKIYDTYKEHVDRNSLEDAVVLAFNKNILQESINNTDKNLKEKLLNYTHEGYSIDNITDDLNKAAANSLYDIIKEKIVELTSNKSVFKNQSKPINVKGKEKKLKITNEQNIDNKNIDNLENLYKTLDYIEKFRGKVTDNFYRVYNEDPIEIQTLINDNARLLSTKKAFESIKKELQTQLSPEHQEKVIKAIQKRIKNNEELNKKRKPLEKIKKEKKELIDKKVIKSKKLKIKTIVNNASLDNTNFEKPVDDKKIDDKEPKPEREIDQIFEIFKNVEETGDEVIGENKKLEKELEKKEEIKKKEKTKETKKEETKNEETKKEEIKKEKSPLDELFDEESINDDFNPKSYSEKARIKRAGLLNQMIKKLEYQIGKDPSFENFLRYLKQFYPKKEIDKLFNYFVVAWKDNNFKKANYKEIYNKVFNPINSLIEEFEETIEPVNTELEDIEDTKELEKTEKEDKKNKIEEEKNNREKEEEKEEEDETFTSKIITSELKATYIFIDPKTKQPKESTDIAPEKCVDYDYMKVGKKFKIKPAKDFNNVVVTIYDNEGNNLGSKPFKDWNFEIGSQEYIDNFPFVAVDPTTNEQIFLVNIPSWYNKRHIGKENTEKQKAIIKEARKTVKEFRKLLYENGSLDIEITDITGSQIETGESLALSKRNPDFNISSVIRNGQSAGQIIFKGKKHIIDVSKSDKPGAHTIDDENKIIFFHNNIKIGNNVDIRFLRYQMVKGIQYKVYGIYKLTQPHNNETNEHNLEDKQIIESIKNAIKTYYSPNTNKENLNVVNNQIDISLDNIMGLMNYIKNFTIIRLSRETVDEFNSVKDAINNTLANFVTKVANSLSRKPVYIGILGNRIILDTIDENINHDLLVIDPNNKTDNKLSEKIDQWFDRNGNKIRLATTESNLYNYYNKEIPLLTDNGIVADRTLSKILADNFESNILSYNIGDNNNPKWITLVQPIIKYRLILKSENKQKIDIKEESELVKEEEKIDKIIENELPDIVKKLLEEADKLNIDTNNIDSVYGNDLSPKILTLKSLQEYYNNITEIEGMNPMEISEMVRYLSNKISDKFNELNQSDNNVILEEELNKELKLKFDEVLGKTIEDKKNLLFDTNKALELYEDKLDKEVRDKLLLLKSKTEDLLKRYDIVKKNFDKLLELAKEKVYEKINIVKTKIEENDINIEESDESYSGQMTEEDIYGINEENVEGYEKKFGKSILEENGKSKFPYKLRRFFDNLEVRTKNNKPVLNSYGLPIYYYFDEIYDKVAELLLFEEDISPNYELMINKLKKYKDKIFWVNDLIERLNKVDDLLKTQFVVNFAKHFIIMKSPTIQETKNKEFNFKVQDANILDIRRRIMNSWNNGFQISGLFNYKNDKFSFNKDFYNEIVKDILEVIPSVKNSNSVLKLNNNIFNKLLKGGKFSKDTIEKLKNDKRTRNIGLIAEAILNNKSNEFVKYSYNIGIENNKKGIGEIYFYKIGDDIYYGKNEKIDYTNEEIHIKIKNILNKLGINVDKNTIKYLSDVGIRIRENKKIKTYTLDQLVRIDSETNINSIGRIFKYILDNGKNIDENYNLDNLPHLKDLMGSNGYTITGIESTYNSYPPSLSININGKNIYLINSRNMATELTDNLKNDKNFIKNLKKFSILSDNIILESLLKPGKYKDYFKLEYLSLSAIQKIGSKLFGDFNVTKLSELDKEIVNLILFQDMSNPTSDIIYKGFETRFVRKMFPTMSDKTQQLLLLLPALKIKESHLNFENNKKLKKFDDKILKVIYEQVVVPEIKRMYNILIENKDPNIANYKESGLIFSIKELNNVRIDGKHIQELFSKGNLDNVIEDSRQNFYNILNSMLLSKYNKKLKKLVELGIIDEKGKSIKFSNNYISKIGGEFKSLKNTQIAVADYIVNDILHNSAIFQLYAGDLALYTKGLDNKEKPWESTNIRSVLNKAYDNVSKRLAILIAPGIVSENSRNSSHIRVFLKDNIKLSDNLGYIASLHYGNEIGNKVTELTKLLKETQNELTLLLENKLPNVSKDTESQLREGIDYLKNLILQYDSKNILSYFMEIEDTDAQEYQTARTALNHLLTYGKIDRKTYDKLLEKINRQIEKENKGLKLEKEDLLSEEELNLVLQNEKPVYGGFIPDQENDANRLVYIKSAAIVLIPQTTIGKEINKLRRALEKLENDSNKNVIASYSTATKLGNIKEPLNIYHPNNTIRDLTIEELKKASLVLSNNYFRIQQEAPYKAGKNKPNTVSMVTQLSKLMFGNGFTNFIFNYHNKAITGKELREKHEEYLINLVNIITEQLKDELGFSLNNNANNKIFVKNLIKLIKKEAKSRNLNTSDIDSISYKTKEEKNGEQKIYFDIPLWMLNDSKKFQALLISIVRNNILKLKFPGYSYIASSSAGWEIADTKNIDLDNIIYTNKFDFEKGLQNSYIKDKNGKKVLQRFQVFVPSRFKDKNNKLIDITDEKYWEIDEKTKRKVLKPGMIDDELLELISTRIPTSSHSLSAAIEIAGFLPEVQGDVIIVPDNLLKTKGLDFDFDKEFTYSYWYDINEDGKITKYNKDVNIDNLTEELNDLKNKYKKYKYLYKLDKSDFIKDFLEAKKNGENVKENYEFKKLSKKEQRKKIKSIENEIKEKKEEIKKSIENEIIYMYNQILASPQKEVQRKILKVLPLDEAINQANTIDKLINKGRTKYNFGIFDDEYHNDTMKKGSSGSILIGVYALESNFSSLLQQIDETLKVSDPSIFPKFKDIEGNIISFDGKLGKIKTLDGNRNITEVIEERVQTAVDNMKANVLGKVNLNKHTVNVDELLTLAGFDQAKSSQGNIYLSYYFLSQPIIKEYVKEIENLKAASSDYEANAESKLLEKILKKYNIENFDNINTDKIINVEDLINNLTNPNKEFQAIILKTFLNLSQYNDVLLNTVTALDISKRLAGDFTEIKDLVNNLEYLISPNGLFENPNVLLGEVIPITSTVDKNKYLDMGFIEIYNTLIKPSNYLSNMVLQGLSTTIKFYSSYYPEFNFLLHNELNKFLASSNATNKYKKKEYSKIFWANIKNFLLTDDILPFYSGTIENERNRLLLDTKNNISLALYSELLKNRNHPIFSNELLKRLDFKIAKKSGQYSTIEFVNTNGSLLYEDALYSAIDELIASNIELPDYNYDTANYKELDSKIFEPIISSNANVILSKENKLDLKINERGKFKLNGKSYKVINYGKLSVEELNELGYTGYTEPQYYYKIESFYTSRDYAQDLINYNLLTNPQTGPVEFTKYIPFSYFKNIGATKELFNYNDFINLSTNITNYITQLFQNYPEYAYKVKDDNKIKELEQQAIENPDLVPEFIAKYQKTDDKNKRYKLYKLINNKYIEIPTIKRGHIKIFNKNSLLAIDIEKEIEKSKEASISNTTKEDKLQKIKSYIDNDQLQELLGYILSILNDNNKRFKDLITEFIKFNKSTIHIKFDSSLNAKGTYKNGTIILNPNESNTPSKLLINLLHEYIHSITSDELKKYFIKSNGRLILDPNAPDHVKELGNIYIEALKLFSTNPYYISMKNKLDKMHIQGINNLSNLEVSLTPEEEAFYPLYNVREFITGMFTNKNFIQLLNSKKYKGKNIISKFVNAIRNFLNKLGIFKKGSLAEEAAIRIMNFVYNEYYPENLIDNKKTESNIKEKEIKEDKVEKNKIEENKIEENMNKNIKKEKDKEEEEINKKLSILKNILDNEHENC